LPWAVGLAAVLTLGLCALRLPPAAAQDTAASALSGRWLTEPRDGIIEITRSADGSFQGRIIGGNAPGRVDARNPDAGRRQQLLLGQIILLGMRPDGAAAWSGGTIYEPDSGRTYKCHLELIDRDHLKVRGFIGVSLLGRSQTWTRYSGASLDLSAPAQ
jgi:uncharacterized protein (DUF2147 family)